MDGNGNGVNGEEEEEEEEGYFRQNLLADIYLYYWLNLSSTQSRPGQCIKVVVAEVKAV